MEYRDMVDNSMVLFDMGDRSVLVMVLFDMMEIAAFSSLMPGGTCHVGDLYDAIVALILVVSCPKCIVWLN